MKNLLLLLLIAPMISFNVNAQNSSSDSIVISNDFFNEINKLKIYNDSVISNFENFKSYTKKKLNDVKRFSNSLNYIIDLNYSENKSISDSLFNNYEELISKIKENTKQLEKQTLIQVKNNDSYLNLNNRANKRMILTSIFLAIIFVCLFFFRFYYKKYNEKIKSEYDLKLNDLISAQRDLNETVSSISSSNDNLKVQNDSLSKNLKNLSQDLIKIKSTLE
jgi:hypothetical protein|tara:strand:- start:308 stop:970 length:663 start_codon:yes stop_codon:yes gene_type:complete